MEIGRSSAIGRLGLNWLLRHRVLPGEKAHAWARHHIEEIGNLEQFLPTLWSVESGISRTRAV